MTEVTKIALTGGPCGGKSTAMKFLEEELAKRGVEVFSVNEVATRLMNEGRTPENMGSYEFHRLLFSIQAKSERECTEKAQGCSAERAVVLCDRGLLDNSVYVEREDFLKYSSEFGYDEERIRNSYSAVFHLTTAAKGAENSYTLSNNSARSEGTERARELDDEILSAWVGTPHLRIIDNSTDFRGKLDRLLAETLAVLGIPEPYEIERKFLIEMPDLELLNRMPNCRRVPITQAYFNTPNEGLFRVRKRGEHTFIKTKKTKISDIRRIEVETELSSEDYEFYMALRMFIQGVISKDRYCIADNSTYYELDVYPFWDDKATLEIELLSEDQEYTMPEYVKVIREVTFEKDYRNKSMAIKYSDFFK